MEVVYIDEDIIVQDVKPAILLLRRFFMTDIEHHIGLMSWAKTQPILSEYLIHIPNGGYRHLKEAIKLKKMGVNAGVSDLFLAYPNSHYHGLWIELKSEQGRLSSEQKAWLILMEQVGYATTISYSIEDTFDVLQSYFENIK